MNETKRNDITLENTWHEHNNLITYEYIIKINMTYINTNDVNITIMIYYKDLNLNLILK